MKALSALLAGALFGAGLLVSGMTDPANVLAFLDVGGAWSTALLYTMGAAVAVAAPAFALARRTRQRSEAVEPPQIDARLVWGSALFGIGWGLTGVCPGPALVLVATGAPHAVVFAIGYVVGVYAVDSLAIGPGHHTHPGAPQAASFF